MTATADRPVTPAAAPANGSATGGVILALGTVYLVWGSTYLAIKYTVADLPPFLAMGVRFLLAGAVLLLVVLVLRGRAVLRVTRQQAVTAVLCGLFMLVGGNGVVAFAEQYVDSGLAALLVAATPLWVVVLRALLHDRPSRTTAVGLGIGMVGVAVLLRPGGGAAHGIGPLLLLCLSSLSWSIGTVLSTRRPLPADPFVITVIQMAAGGAAMVVIGSLSGEWSGVDLGSVAASAWLAWGYLVLIGSVVTYSAYVWLLARAPVSLATTYAYVNPAVAVALGAIFRHEPLTPAVITGGAVIIVAVAVVISRESRQRRPAVPTTDGGAAPIEPV